MTKGNIYHNYFEVTVQNIRFRIEEMEKEETANKDNHLTYQSLLKFFFTMCGVLLIHNARDNRRAQRVRVERLCYAILLVFIMRKNKSKCWYGTSTNYEVSFCRYYLCQRKDISTCPTKRQRRINERKTKNV